MQALAASAARLDAKTILLNGDLLGRILDTFVMTQMRPEVAFMHPRAQLHHVRYDNGKLEVDAVIDMGAGRIIGVEVKATSAPGKNDARHLCSLRNKLGDEFVTGLILHTGPAAFEIDERVIAAPMSALWTT